MVEENVDVLVVPQHEVGKRPASENFLVFSIGGGYCLQCLDEENKPIVFKINHHATKTTVKLDLCKMEFLSKEGNRVFLIEAEATKECTDPLPLELLYNYETGRGKQRNKKREVRVTFV